MKLPTVAWVFLFTLVLLSALTIGTNFFVYFREKHEEAVCVRWDNTGGMHCFNVGAYVSCTPAKRCAQYRTEQ